MTTPEERTTYILADLARSIRIENVPNGAVRKAKELILDAIGCNLGGVNTEQGKKMRALYGSMGGGARGNGLRNPRKDAAPQCPVRECLSFDRT